VMHASGTVESQVAADDGSVTSTVVPACTTALVTNSLISSVASSTTRSGKAAASGRP